MRRLLLATVTCSLALVAAGPLVVLASGGSRGVALFGVLVAVLCGVMALAARRLQVPLEVMLLLLLPFAVSFGLGEPFGLFTRVAQFDKVCHLTGGLSLGILAAGWVRAQRPARHRGLAMLIAALGLAALLGSIWEIGEVVLDLAVQSHTSGTALDTAGDLTADLLGGGLGALAVALAPLYLRDPARLGFSLRRLSLARS